MRANEFVIHRTAKALRVSQQSIYRLLDNHDILYAKKISRDPFIEHFDAVGGDIATMAMRLEVSERALRLRKRSLGL